MIVRLSKEIQSIIKTLFHVCDDDFQVLKENFELSDLFYLAHIYLSMLAQNGSVRFAKYFYRYISPKRNDDKRSYKCWCQNN